MGWHPEETESRREMSNKLANKPVYLSEFTGDSPWMYLWVFLGWGMWKRRLTLACATREHLYVRLGLFSRLLYTLSVGVPGRMRWSLYTCDMSVVNPGWPICRRWSILQSVCLVLLSCVGYCCRRTTAAMEAQEKSCVTCIFKICEDDRGFLDVFIL